MSAGVRVPASVARDVAAELLARLGPSCERIEVAGSLRRGSPDVGDLELVAIPKTRTEVDPAVLWGEPIVIHEVGEAIEALQAEGVVTMAGFEVGASGQRYRKLRHVRSGLQVDLFTVLPPAQWGVIFLIRTGPADFSHRFVTDIRRRGFHVREGALHRGSLGCGAVACEVVQTPEEADVFRAAGWGLIPPGDRR